MRNALGWSLQRQTSACEGLLLYLQREVWHSRAPLSAFLGWRRFSIKSRLSMQGSQEKGRGWSAARPLKRCVRLRDLRHFHTLFAGRSDLELCGCFSLTSSASFGWVRAQQSERDPAQREVPRCIPQNKTDTSSELRLDRYLTVIRTPWALGSSALWLQYFATAQKKNILHGYYG